MSMYKPPVSPQRIAFEAWYRDNDSGANLVRTGKGYIDNTTSVAWRAWQAAQKNGEPAAWVYPEFFEGIARAGCWTAYAGDGVGQNPDGVVRIPLYRGPQRAAPVQETVAQAWDEGYRAGIDDERMSEANIGIAGFSGKVQPARNNPYRATPPAAQSAPEGMDEFLADLERSRTKYPKNGRMFDGLMGEVDELRRAYAGDGDVRAEAFDVAVCAYRIATEGDAGGNTLLDTPPAATVQEPVAVIGSDFQLLYCREDWAKGLKVGDTLCLCPPPAAQPAAAIEWPKTRDVGRYGDMSTSAPLRVGLDSDNDVYMSVWDENGGASVEFCNPGGGGGGSSTATRMALIALMVAMEQDNARRPDKDWWAKRMKGGS